MPLVSGIDYIEQRIPVMVRNVLLDSILKVHDTSTTWSEYVNLC